jgi:hemerythrin-like domain-containing protein
MMLLEHQEGRGLVARMESALAARDPWGFVASAGAYAGLLRAHIAKERDVLFRMAAQRLGGDDDRTLCERFAAIEREAGGEALHARFHAELEAWKRELGSLAVAAPPPHAVAGRPQR